MPPAGGFCSLSLTDFSASSLAFLSSTSFYACSSAYFFLASSSFSFFNLIAFFSIRLINLLNDFARSSSLNYTIVFPLAYSSSVSTLSSLPFFFSYDSSYPSGLLASMNCYMISASVGFGEPHISQFG